MAGLVQDLLLCLFNAEVKQWGSLDSFCSHTWDVQKKKNPSTETRNSSMLLFVSAL